MTPLEFFRTEQFSNELSENLSNSDINKLIQFGYDLIEFANHIKDNHLYDDYGVTENKIKFDIEATTHNIGELKKALPNSKKDVFDYTALGTFCLN